METGVQVGVDKGVSVGGPPRVAVAMTGDGVGTAVNVAPTACCTASAMACAVAAASGVGCRVMGTGVAATVVGATVGAGGCAVKVALTPLMINACSALAVAVASTVAVAGATGVAVKVGRVVVSLPPVLPVTVASGAGSVGPANRSPKK